MTRIPLPLVELVLGLVANLFTTAFVCRLIFDVLDRNGWGRHFSMLRLLGRLAGTSCECGSRRWLGAKPRPLVS